MKKSIILLSLLGSLVLPNCFNTNEYKLLEAAIGDLPPTSNSGELSSNYYDSVNGLTGDELLEGLASLSLENHKFFNTYDQTKGGCAYADAALDGSSTMIDFYTGWKIPNDWDNGSTWNREHVWCRSLSGGLFGYEYAGSDIHHIRPTISSINSTRNNGLFTDRDNCGNISLTEYIYNGSELSEYKGKSTGCYRSGSSYFEPSDISKGDVARILMYLYMHYSNEVTVNKDSSKKYIGSLIITNICYTSDKTPQAAWDMLLEWNEIDPVDELERNRNNYCASVTGVRNPFIDNSGYANAIWGDGTLPDQGGDTPEPVKNVTITFDCNNGSFANGSTTASYEIEEGSKLTTIPSNPTRSGYTFKGWSINGTTIIDLNTYTFSVDTTIIALWTKDEVVEPEVNEGKYTLVTDVNDLQVGDNIVIGCSSKNTVAGLLGSQKYFASQSATFENGVITSEVDNYKFTLGKNGNYWTLTNSEGLISTSAAKALNKNNLGVSTWNITINNGSATIKSSTSSYGWIQYNENSPRFLNYNSNQTSVEIYKLVVSSVTPEPEPEVKSEGDYFSENNTLTKLRLGYIEDTKTTQTTTQGVNYSYTFASKQYSSNSTKTLNNVDWTLAGSGGNYWGYDGTKGQQFGSGNAPYKSMTLKSEEFSNVTKVIVSTSGASDIAGTLTVTVGGTQIGSKISLTSSNKSYEFISNSSLSGEVVLSYAQTSKKAIYIKSIAVSSEGKTETTTETTYEITSAQIGYGAIINKKAYNSNATYGMLVLPTTSVGNNVISNYADGCTNIDDLKANLKADGISSINYSSTPVKVNAEGKEDNNGEYYQFGVFFKNSLQNLDNSLTAVAYMELDNKVYVTLQTSYSLRSLCQGYLNSGIMADNEIAIELLNKVVNYEVN